MNVSTYAPCVKSADFSTGSGQYAPPPAYTGDPSGASAPDGLTGDQRMALALGGQVPTYAALSTDDLLRQRIAQRNAFVQRHEISASCQKWLDKLAKWHVVVVADDSGSMNDCDELGQPSEWEKLKSATRVIVELGTIYDSAGPTVHFLNRGTVGRIAREEELEPYFVAPADGMTPLPETLVQLYAENRNNEKSTVFVIPTDGHPTFKGDLALGDQKLLEFLTGREKESSLCEKFPLSFVMCTEDQSVVQYYHKLAKRFSHIAVTEVYAEEKKRMQNLVHKGESYTYGQWVLHMVMGAQEVYAIGRTDEIPEAERPALRPSAQPQTESCCCIVQ